jgi:thiol-disulfide isomerase/thioredoxin
MLRRRFWTLLTLLLLPVVLLLLVLWGPWQFARGIGDCWDTVCARLGWNQSLPPAHPEAPSPGTPRSTRALKLAAGSPAPDFVLKDLEGADFHLRDPANKKPLVLEFGSYSCPFCRAQFDPMDKLLARYRDRVDFLFIYCREAHPEKATDGSRPVKQGPVLRADTYEERLQVARWLQRTMHPKRRILVDDFGDQSVFDRYFDSGFDDPLVVVDKDGVIALGMNWTDAAALSGFLDQLLSHGGKWDSSLVPPANTLSQSPSFSDLQKSRGRK